MEEIRKFPIGKIFAFFTSILVVVFIALMIYNLNMALGGTNILNGNLQPLFNHQTVFENYKGGQIQSIKNVQTSSMGIRYNVAVAELGHCEDAKHTKKGSIDFSVVISSCQPMELCYQPTDLIGYIYADVRGNYEPYLAGDQFVILSQDKDPVKGGRATIDWVWDHDESCYVDYWTGTIRAAEEIRLASDQYPIVSGPAGCTFGLKDISPDRYTYIQGKMVDFDWTMDWTGCDDFTEQGFTIIPLRAKY